MNGNFYYDAPGSHTQSLADIHISGMCGQPAAGFYRWHINLSVAMHASSESNARKMAIADVHGELSLPSRGNRPELLLSRVFQTEPRERLIGIFNRATDQFTVEAELDSRRILAVEEWRAGGDMHLQMKLWGAAVNTTTNERFPAKGDMGLPVNQSSWQSVLAGMEYRQTMLLEVPMLVKVNDPILAEVAEHVANASGHLTNGHYRAAVAACRDALDSLKIKLPDLAEISENPKLATKEQRIAKLSAALRQVTHLAHHTDEISKMTEWTPEDAQAVLLMTGALLRMAVAGSNGAN